jgi:hypothetical protein
VKGPDFYYYWLIWKNGLTGVMSFDPDQLGACEICERTTSFYLTWNNVLRVHPACYKELDVKIRLLRQRDV